MRYVQLGDTDLTVSRLCLGGNSWGARGRRAWAPFGPDESAAFFKAARNLGITFFDTAESYNDGESERIIGSRLIGEHPRAELVICTKAMLGADIRDPRQHIVETVEASLARLKTDHIDLFCLHRLDPSLPVEAVVAGLDDVVTSGKVRYAGASTMRPTQFARIVTLAKGSAVRFAAMQNLHNLLYREEEHDMNPFCAEEGIATMPYSPLARGMLSGARLGESGLSERARLDALGDYYKQQDERNRPVVEQLVAVAQARGVKPMQVALAWLLSKRPVAAAVIGATRQDQLADAVGALALTLSPDEIAALEALYRPTAPVYA